MSVVTNLYLWTALGDNDDFSPRQIEEINRWLEQEYGGVLNRLDDKVGGTKSAEHCLYGGAFNYLRLDEFLEFLVGLDWSHAWDTSRDQVRVIVQGHEQMTPSVYAIGGSGPVEELAGAAD